MAKDITVGTAQSSAPGRAKGTLKIAETPDGSPCEIPVVIVQGEKETTLLFSTQLFVASAAVCNWSIQVDPLKRQRLKPASALLTTAEIGWLTSWAIEAVSCPIVVTRLAFASSIRVSR